MQVTNIRLIKIPLSGGPANCNAGRSISAQKAFTQSICIIPPVNGAEIDASEILASPHFLYAIELLDINASHLAVHLNNVRNSGIKISADQLLTLTCIGLRESLPLLSLTGQTLELYDLLQCSFRLGEAYQLTKDVIFSDRHEWMSFCALYLFNPVFRNNFTQRFLSLPDGLDLEEFIEKAELNKGLFQYGELSASLINAEGIYFEVFYRLDTADEGSKLRIIKDLFDDYSCEIGQMAVARAALVDQGMEVVPLLIEHAAMLGEKEAFEVVEEIAGRENDSFVCDGNRTCPVFRYLLKILQEKKDLDQPVRQRIKNLLSDYAAGMFVLMDSALTSPTPVITELILKMLGRKEVPAEFLLGIIRALAPEGGQGRQEFTSNLTWQILDFILSFISRDAFSFQDADKYLLDMELLSNEAEKDRLRVPKEMQKYFEFELSKLFYLLIIRGNFLGQPDRQDIDQAKNAAVMVIEHAQDDFSPDFIPSYIASRMPVNAGAEKNAPETIQKIVRRMTLSMLGRIFKENGQLKHFPEVLIHANLLNEDAREHKIKVMHSNLRLRKVLLDLLGQERYDDAYGLIAKIIKKAKQINPDFTEKEIDEALRSNVS